MADESNNPNECSNCGARRIIPDVQVVDRDGEFGDKSLTLRVDKSPNAIFFKGTMVTTVRASVCASCGLTQMFAVDPELLWKAYHDGVKE